MIPLWLDLWTRNSTTKAWSHWSSANGDSWTVLSSVTVTLCNAASVMDTVNRNHTLSILAMVVLSYLKKLSLCRRLTQSVLRFSRLTFRKDILSNHSLMWRTGHWHKTWLVFYLMRLLRLARWLWHELLWFYQGCVINVWELPSRLGWNGSVSIAMAQICMVVYRAARSMPSTEVHWNELNATPC